MNATDISKSYDFRNVELKWYRYWEENGLFRADETRDEKPYSIVIPPPNVTGSLHMGHALNNTLQDVLCRYKRLKGFNVLWMPGTDHAGIATQNVVEKELAREGKDRHELGREQFIERVWQWRSKYGGMIINQLKRLGASCDWSRERFTMDEGLSRAVRKVFVTLYREGLIYRGDYIINWCPRCRTALADLEVEHHEQEGHLYHIKYLFPGSTKGLVIATTRPETMLGDTAVAINPEDPRFKDLDREELVLPLMNRVLPIIRDSYVDVGFGTGVLKITPAHDANDFLIGEQHGLESIVIMDESGRMNENAGAYQGLDRFEARGKVVKDLEKLGLLEKIEPYQHNVGHCYRCRTMIEPILSKQWFVKVAPLARDASRAVREGKTSIIPKMWENTYFDWMDNIRDWCVSRQIWWGHRIPAWYCKNCPEIVVDMEEPETCPKCGGELVQETDVLDTWFSSALWPFSTMGWPDKTPELGIFYPTSVLITGFDILFFWVARMMMMGIHFMNDVHFRDVYIHALVRDAEGQKMSKSKGNVIDPLIVMDKYGTDAFRFTLAAFAAQGRDVLMSEDRVEGYRHFVNKVWNASRFALMNLEDMDLNVAVGDAERTLADRWILSRTGKVASQVARALEEYRFNDAAMDLYQFAWHEFCDWYLEEAKLVFYGKYRGESKAASQRTLYETLLALLKMLHPFMPFVTEEIWNLVPGTQNSIMTATYPEFEKWVDNGVEEEMALLMDVISSVRNIRGEMHIPPSKDVDLILYSTNSSDLEQLKELDTYIRDLCKVQQIQWRRDGDRPKKAASAVCRNVEVFVPLEGLIDFGYECKRLKKELDKIDKELGYARKKLVNEDFLSRAPKQVVAKEREKAEELEGRLKKLEANYQRIVAMAS
ncbi:MAG: valine--tRNA ligase [Deltaproteobacteria bacterium]|nr:valine--tRNA ligase [Deltaproteobacteria bacterium]